MRATNSGATLVIYCFSFIRTHNKIQSYAVFRLPDNDESYPFYPPLGAGRLGATVTTKQSNERVHCRRRLATLSSAVLLALHRRGCFDSPKGVIGEVYGYQFMVVFG